MIFMISICCRGYQTRMFLTQPFQHTVRSHPETLRTQPIMQPTGCAVVRRQSTLEVQSKLSSKQKTPVGYKTNKEQLLTSHIIYVQVKTASSLLNSQMTIGSHHPLRTFVHALYFIPRFQVTAFTLDIVEPHVTLPSDSFRFLWPSP